MSGDRLVGFVSIALMLTLVGSALVARRLPFKRVVKLGLAWLAIFALAFVVAQSLG